MVTWVEKVSFRTLDLPGFCKKNQTRVLFSFLFFILFLPFSVFGQVETNFSAGGAVRVGDSTTVCAPAIEGAIRFDADGADTLDYCDGANWLSLLTSSVGGAIVNNGNSFAAPMIIGTNDTQELRFETNGTTRVTIDTSGNVGIGTTTPTEILQINGNIRMNASGYPQRGVYFGNNGGNPSIYSTGSTAPAWTNVIENDNVRIKLDTDPGGSDWFDVVDNSNNRLFFISEPTGFTGVGDASPDAHFEISANGTSGGSIFLVSSDDNNDGDLLTVLESGHVGIGTTAPAVELDVNTGTINAASICDENNANCLDLSAGVGGSGDFMADGTVPMTGAFEAADGSAAAPSITFANDTNSGFYLSGGNSIGITVNGVNHGAMTNSSWELYRKIRTSNCSVTEPCFSFSGDNDTGMFRSGTDELGFSTNAIERMVIDASGNVGIGSTSPAHALDVVGNIQYTGSLIDASDRRLKRDVASLENPLDTITEIEGVSFIMKDDPDEQVEYGVIAQQVEEVLPELVHTKNDEMGSKAVNYIGFIGWIIEGVKELNNKCEATKEDLQKISALSLQNKRDIASLKEMSGRKEQRIEALESENQKLKKELKSIRELLMKHNIQ